jgi:hypothetical protein
VRRAVGTGSIVASAAVIATAGLIHLGRTYGSTRAERRTPLPGDEVIAAPTVQTDNAITIEAPPEQVWPWLVQMGWGRAGWYTARWVDQLLFPANGPSADRIVPELQDIRVGTFIPDGPPETECGLYVIELVPERALVLRSNSHLPMSWRSRATLDWTWVFVLTPEGDGRRTRFHFRSRWVTGPTWFTIVGWLGVVPANFVMARDMLRGVRQRVELDVPREVSDAGLGAARRGGARRWRSRLRRGRAWRRPPRARRHRGARRPCAA